MINRIGVIGKFTAQPGARDRLAGRLLQAASRMGEVPGCELYVVSRSASEPEVLWVTEIWRSAADHEASLAAPGVREFIQETLPLLAGPPERTDTVPLGGHGISR